MGRYEEAFRELNPAQRKAVETIEGPVLVIAGPGTGKTQLLTTRIAHILAKTDTLPQNILALTFTDSAAQTMQERLSGLIGQAAYDVTISTYHAFGSDIIRRFPEFFAEQADLQPADDLTIDRIFRQIIDSLPYSNPLKYSDAYLGVPSWPRK
jgi:DNA helicase II / ATP-dependent DNA helicase PcrA